MIFWDVHIQVVQTARQNVNISDIKTPTLALDSPLCHIHHVSFYGYHIYILLGGIRYTQRQSNLTMESPPLLDSYNVILVKRLVIIAKAD